MALQAGPSTRRPAAWRDLAAWSPSRRRLLVAVLTGLAVVCTITALRPKPAPTTRVWVAARDLAGGAPLGATDMTIARLPVASVPSGALPATSSVVGRMLAAPMRRGEPLTDVRLLSPSLLAAGGQSRDVAVPVRVDDGPAALALVHAGDLVDVIAATDGSAGVAGPASTVVHDVRVLATPVHDGDSSGSDDDAGLLIVAASHRQATALAQAADGAQLSIAVRGPA
jgi:Flp pilus assembly protein CpaB